MLENISPNGNFAETQKIFEVVSYSLNPSTGLLAVLSTFLATAIPIIVVLVYTFILSDAWLYKTIKIEAVYYNMKRCYLERIFSAIALTLIIFLVTLVLSYTINRFFWQNLVRNNDILCHVPVIKTGPGVLVKLIAVLIAGSVLFQTLGYALTYTFRTNIPFVVMLFANVAFNGHRFLPVTIFRGIIAWAFFEIKTVPLLVYLTPSLSRDYSFLFSGFPHPFLIVFAYSILASALTFFAIKHVKVG